MATQQHFRISGSGSYLPLKCVTAAELDQRCGVDPGWCVQQVGVETRYECLAPETMISMGCEAIQAALDDANLQWHDVDMLIDCSTSQFRPIPCNAAHYQAQFGEVAESIPCFDVQSTCLGSIVAINLVNSLFAGGSCRNVVLVASECGLAGVNYGEPESACLMGDGAAALVLSRKPLTNSFAFCHETYAAHIELCRVEGGGHKLPVFEYTSEREGEYRFTMDGPSVFRVALKRLKPMVGPLIEKWQNATGLNASELHFVPHQASPRGLQAVKRLFQVEDSHFHVAVDSIGNLVAAGLPFMIDRIRKSAEAPSIERVLLLGTSAGYSQAALICDL